MEALGNGIGALQFAGCLFPRVVGLRIFIVDVQYVAVLFHITVDGLRVVQDLRYSFALHLEGFSLHIDGVGQGHIAQKRHFHIDLQDVFACRFSHHIAGRFFVYLRRRRRECRAAGHSQGRDRTKSLFYTHS